MVQASPSADACCAWTGQSGRVAPATPSDEPAAFLPIRSPSGQWLCSPVDVEDELTLASTGHDESLRMALDPTKDKVRALTHVAHNLVRGTPEAGGPETGANH